MSCHINDGGHSIFMLRRQALQHKNALKKNYYSWKEHVEINKIARFEDRNLNLARNITCMFEKYELIPLTILAGRHRLPNDECSNTKCRFLKVHMVLSLTLLRLNFTVLLILKFSFHYLH